MNIQQATREFETWLSSHISLVAEDLAVKHFQMADGIFPFFRATFYRWMQLWPAVGHQLTDAPDVLAIGDLHVENFGTWRDAEGRLAWGVNDFDEATRLPYTMDLVRLAASALLACGSDHLAISPKAACDAILSGYADSLNAGGEPFVLAEKHAWLRSSAEDRVRDPAVFWQTLDDLPVVNDPLPPDAAMTIEELLPVRGLDYRVVKRIKGLGSLGRQRFTALAKWCGGMIAREAKALAPSACHWATGRIQDLQIQYPVILAAATRCPDPFLHAGEHWVVRRLAPDCTRIELASLTKAASEARVLRAMGWETANVHLGSDGATRDVLGDLRKQPEHWLLTAARKMLNSVAADWEEWKTVKRK